MDAHDTDRPRGPVVAATADLGPSFEVLPPDGPEVPVLVHVPHASTAIDADVRADLDVDDARLAEEVRTMTDHRTDVLAARVGAAGAWRFVNRRSRLVVDPERFPDDREEMRTRGMGAVYTHGHDRRRLRRDDVGRDADLIARFFTPYAAAFAELTSTLLDRHGQVTIVDVHSFPRVRLPYELHDGPRPPLCLGTDPVHTPPWLAARVEQVAAEHRLEVARDTPFAGAYVPSDRYGSDRDVRAVMLEIRRDRYLDEATATPHDGEATISRFVADVVRAVAAPDGP